MTSFLGTIQLHTIRLYAFHGCLPEERRVGTQYTVDLTVDADVSRAAASDSLEDTVDYAKLYQIVETEMHIPSDLLEHVAQRIIDHIFKELDEVNAVRISVAKTNPPIPGDVKAVSVSLEAKR